MLLTPLLLALFFSFIPQTNANVAPCDTYQVNGGDQAFLMNLNTPLKWGDTVYTNNIYISPKGTVTFGQGDYTFWDYPATPSISIGSWDYHAFANNGNSQWDPGWGIGKNLYVRYGSTATSICVDWKVMLWGQSSGNPIYIRMLAEVNPVDYSWQPTYQVSSNAPGGARYGARYTQNGPIQPLSVQTISALTPPPPSPTPTPTITPTPTPTPTPSETPTPTPTPTETPTPTPTPTEIPTPTPEPTPTQTQDPDPVQPDPDPTPVETQTSEPEPQVTEEPQVEEEQTLEPSPEPTPIEEIISVEEEVNNAIDELIVNEKEITNEQLDNITELLLANYEVNEVMPVAELLDNLSDEQVLELLEQLDENQIIEYREGVELEAGVAVVFEQLADPAALLGEFVSDPGQVLEALGQLGADMTEEEREDSQDVVVAAVVATQVATMAMTMAPPSAPSAPAPSSPQGPSGPGSQPKNEFDAGSGGEARRKPKVKVKKKVKIKKPKVKIKRNNRRIK
jgi:hypothetical protein